MSETQGADLELMIQEHGEADLLIANARMIFPNIWEKSTYNDGDPKFDVTLLIPKDDTENVAALKEYVRKVAKENGVKATKQNTFVRDAEEAGKEQEYFTGMLIVRGKSKFPIPIYARDDEEDLVEIDASYREDYCYSGSYVSVILRGWAGKPEKGGPRVGAYVQAVVHEGHGEHISGGFSAAQAASAFGAGQVKKAKPKAKPQPAPQFPSRGDGTKAQQVSGKVAMRQRPRSQPASAAPSPDEQLDQVFEDDPEVDQPNDDFDDL